MAKLCVTAPIQNCFVLSLSTIFVYTAFSALYNLQSSLNREASLGVASLSVLNVCIVISSTLSPIIIKTIGAKRTIILSWLSSFIYVALNFHPSWATLIPASAQLGSSLGLLWTSNCLYISVSGEQYARFNGISSEKGIHSVVNKFIGTNIMCFHISHLFGNVISSLVLSIDLTANDSSQVLDFDLCGANDCPGMNYSKNGTNATDGFREPEQHILFILMGVLLVSVGCGLFLTVFALLPLEQTGNSRKSSKINYGDAASCLRIAISAKIVPLVPLFISDGFLAALFGTDYTKAFISCILGVQWVGFIMMSYGAICATFSLLSVRYLVKYLGRIVMIVAGILLAVGSLVVMLSWQPSTKDSLPIYFIVPLMGGVSTGLISPQFVAIVAQLFDNENKSAGFAALVAIRSVSFAGAFTLSIFVCLRQRLVLALCLYVLALVCYLWTEFKVRRRTTSDERITTESQTIL